jgi:HlyD family secretion protein
LATSTLIFILIGVAAVAIGATFIVRGTSKDTSTTTASDSYSVRLGTFDVTIPASGELAALRQTEIASQLEGRATITEIVDEGEQVSEGDVLVRLDDEDIRNRLKDAEVAVKNAETALITARSNLQIKRDAAASDLALKDVDIRLAELALESWEQGERISERQKLELSVETARKDYERLVARYEASGKLLEQNFISQDEYDQDEIAMIRARSSLQQAESALEVYLNYTVKQRRQQLEADLKRARDTRTETKQRNETEIKKLETEVESKQVSLSREEDRLAKLQRQLEQCTIIAPQDGLVVYASSLSERRWRDEDPPQVGSEVSRNRTIMILPDVSQMVAEVKVNEALSGKIERGQKAVVYSDAVPDTPLDGEVLGVGVLAESGGWRDPNRRDYTVRIRLTDTNDLGLKPSMRCKAEIYVDRVDDVLFVPIQAVHREGPIAYVYLPDGPGYQQQPVQIARSSELYIEVIDGLEEGDSVLLSKPSPDRVTQTVGRQATRGNGSSDAEGRRGQRGPASGGSGASGPA